ncbi:MAG: hypothetical protein GY822_12820, partial [Deltaproteobacteria bacterium]|nr:hypothetical protein [Deltaproteobacteria bacterium]
DSVDAGSDGTGSVTEDASTTTATGSVSASDVDGDDSTFTYGIGTAAGTYGDLTMSGAAWTYTLNNADTDTNALDAGDSVTDAFTITVTESSSSSTDTMTVTITVTGADDDVSAGSDQTGAVTEDATATTATGTIAGSDADDASSLAYTGDATGTYGSIAVVSGSGAWTYTLSNSDADTTALDAGDSVTDAFTMTVTDSASSET